MMRRALLFATVILGLPACNGRSASGDWAQIDKDDDKTLYVLGVLLGRNLHAFNLTPAELETVKAGLTDETLGIKPKVSVDRFGAQVNQLRSTRMGAKSEEEKRKGNEFAGRAAAEAGAERTASGLVLKLLSSGEGETPKNNDSVKVNYKGTLIDGTEFDSSYERGQPVELSLMSVIPCWTEAMQKMKPGAKARLVCPSSIAYGDGGRPPSIPGGATLVFEIELVSVTAKPAPALPPMPLAPAAPKSPVPPKKPEAARPLR
jgi:FKBP-type peptidyl-prolyl cis-trans isomerase FkpA